MEMKTSPYVDPFYEAYPLYRRVTGLKGESVDVTKKKLTLTPSSNVPYYNMLKGLCDLVWEWQRSRGIEEKTKL